MNFFVVCGSMLGCPRPVLSCKPVLHGNPVADLPVCAMSTDNWKTVRLFLAGSFGYIHYP